MFMSWITLCKFFQKPRCKMHIEFLRTQPSMEGLTSIVCFSGPTALCANISISQLLCGVWHLSLSRVWTLNTQMCVRSWPSPKPLDPVLTHLSRSTTMYDPNFAIFEDAFLYLSFVSSSWFKSKLVVSTLYTDIVLI